jgi:hypothetical protein
VPESVPDAVAAAADLLDPADRLRTAARELAEGCVDLRCEPDVLLVDTVRALEAAQKAVDSARVALVAELDARAEPLRRTGLRTPGWLAHEFGLPRPVAGRHVAVARKLRHDLPTVADALRGGRIGIDHAALLCRLANGRVAGIVADVQDALIDLADGVRFERWARDVSALIDLADVEGGHDPTPDRQRLTLTDGLSGELHLDADLNGPDAATVRAALRAEADRRFRHHQQLRTADPDHPVPSHAQLLAEALVELCRRGTADRPGATAPVTDVTLVIHASDPADARTPDGVRLPDGTTRTLLCDPAIRALVIDSLGVPLDLGTTVRYANDDQRRAATVRDGGCVHPGCDAPPTWCHLHHVHHAADGGPTDLDNLASVCPQHHHLWHQTGWHVTPATDGWFTITTPTGRQLRSQRHGRPPPSPGPPGPP